MKLKENYYIMDPAKAVELCDENTICVCAILGSTYNGEFENVELLNDLLAKKNAEKGYGPTQTLPTVLAADISNGDAAKLPSSLINF